MGDARIFGAWLSRKTIIASVETCSRKPTNRMTLILRLWPYMLETRRIIMARKYGEQADVTEHWVSDEDAYWPCIEKKTADINTDITWAFKTPGWFTSASGTDSVQVCELIIHLRKGDRLQKWLFEIESGALTSESMNEVCRDKKNMLELMQHKGKWRGRTPGCIVGNT